MQCSFIQVDVPSIFVQNIARRRQKHDHDEQHEPLLFNRCPAAAAGRRRRRRRPLWRPPPLPPRPLLPPLEHRGMDDCRLRRHYCYSHGEVLVRDVNSRQLVLYKKAGTLSVSQLPNKCHCFSLLTIVCF